MKKVYFLQTCDTCRRILKEVNLDGFEQQEIKSTPITAAQLDEMYRFTQSYEALFNKRARKAKELDLKNNPIADAEYRSLIANEYTFLKRPVFIVDDEIFVGNSKKVIEQLKAKVN
jgi:arsenate reductase